MIPTPWRHAAIATLFVAAILPGTALAQSASGFSGFGGSDGGPIQIEARELEVRDKDGVAIFTGDIRHRLVKVTNEEVAECFSERRFFNANAGFRSNGQCQLRLV